MCVDATDPAKGNWLRYVNWARSGEEQNLFPLEINKAIYYNVLRVGQKHSRNLNKREARLYECLKKKKNTSM